MFHVSISDTSLFGWNRTYMLGAAICMSSAKIMRLVWGSDHGRMLALGQQIKMAMSRDDGMRQQQNSMVTCECRRGMEDVRCAAVV